ncbi:MAG: Si-specific NAD(P)(+) transhydrogenase [Ignavibacteriales bacterium]|nr:Si-specific NAD(P)(+) transhydrogenase [Ignavibacteriales bacterium]
MENQYDVIIIGSGPGGEGAALALAKAKKTVAVVDEFYSVGGSCTHKGTIPSKALRQNIQNLIDRGDTWGVDYQELLKSTEAIIETQVQMRMNFYKKNSINIINGRAEFVNSNSISVTMPDNSKSIYNAKNFVIATGSSPYHSPDIDFSHPRIMDSDKILRTKLKFKTMIIYGAGIIGCEYASIFRGLGIDIDLINTRHRLLSFLDGEISDALSYHLRESGIVIRNNEECEKIEAGKDKVVLSLKSSKVISADVILVAQGRTGNSANIGLEKLSIGTDSRGSIKVSEYYQTEKSNIYAVGDVIGFPSLASAAYDQGRLAALHILDKSKVNKINCTIPTGIYTIPEISCIGYTEKELTDLKMPYEVGHSFFKNLTRAQIMRKTTGVLKILFHKQTLEILGIHCFGPQATEIIHIGQAIMMQKNKGNTIEYFIDNTFNYPTMAEAYRVAALNGMDKLN